MQTPVPPSLLRAAGVVFDPTATGIERYSHAASGRGCVRQPYMSASRYAAELTRFCDDIRARQHAKTRSLLAAKSGRPTRHRREVMTRIRYAALVHRATAEAEGSSLGVVERLVYRLAYRYVRGPFRRGDRQEAARDMALQATCDVAVQTGRLAEFDSLTVGTTTESAQ